MRQDELLRRFPSKVLQTIPNSLPTKGSLKAWDESLSVFASTFSREVKGFMVASAASTFIFGEPVQFSTPTAIHTVRGPAGRSGILQTLDLVGLANSWYLYLAITMEAVDLNLMKH